MNTEETSEKTTTEVFYEEPEAKATDVTDGDKETKPEEKTEEQSTSDKGEPKNEEKPGKEGEGESEEDKPAEDTELKSADDLKVPDGAQLQAETVKEVYEQAKELGLNKTQAQAFLEAKSLTDTQLQDKAQSALEGMKAAWLEEFKNDPEIGGDKALETAEHSKRAMDAFASPKLKEAMDKSGFGNHPEMLRMFSKIGKGLLANDSFVSGKSVSTTPKSTAEIFYGSEN